MCIYIYIYICIYTHIFAQGHGTAAQWRRADNGNCEPMQEEGSLRAGDGLMYRGIWLPRGFREDQMRYQYSFQSFSRSENWIYTYIHIYIYIYTYLCLICNHQGHGNHVGRSHVGRFKRTGCTGMLVHVRRLHH